MSRKYLFLPFSVFLSSAIVQAATRDIIPAGTLLHCTMDEPNFSAKTAQVGDPVLCNLGPLGERLGIRFSRAAPSSAGICRTIRAPATLSARAGWRLNLTA